MVLSHAHIDHSGNLPTLVKNGFAGPIYTTPATIDLCNWMLRDTAHIQEKDAEFLNKRLEKRKAAGASARMAQRIVEPLYTMADAERTLPLFQPVPYHEPCDLSPTAELRGLRRRPHPRLLLHGAARYVGRRAAAPDLLGRRGPAEPADHPRPGDDAAGRLPDHGEHLRRPAAQAASSTSINKLADVVNRTARRGGRIIVPAFAVGRTQQLVLLLHQLVNEKRIPEHPDLRGQPAGA